MQTSPVLKRVDGGDSSGDCELRMTVPALTPFGVVFTFFLSEEEEDEEDEEVEEESIGVDCRGGGGGGGGGDGEVVSILLFLLLNARSLLLLASGSGGVEEESLRGGTGSGEAMRPCFMAQSLANSRPSFTSFTVFCLLGD